MAILNLERMFRPKSVAVIGASEKTGSLGTALMRNLIGGGFKGEIYPVNPFHPEVFNLTCFSTIKKIQKVIDLAIIATPIRYAPKIISECSKAGVGGAVVISAGGKEIGKAGVILEKEILQASKNNLRIIGPNCLGVVSTQSQLNATFASRMPATGKMAFISQSGAICTSILDFSIKENMGFSYFVSLGSMLDVDFGDMIDFVGADPEVSSIVLYIENLTHIRNFMSAARAVSRIKPIIALKAGRSHAGAKAAASHTGALASADAVYDAAFRRAGIVRVKTFEELFDCAEFLAKQPLPEGPGLAIVTNAGGPGVMAADALADHHAEPTALARETIEQLDKLLPYYWSRSNPVDILGDATPERYQMVVKTLMKAKGVDGLLIMFSPQAVADPSEVASALSDFLQDKNFPVFTVWMGGAGVAAGREIFNRAGISTFDTPERAVRAFMDLYRYARNREMLQEVPPKLQNRLTFERKAAEEIISCALAQTKGCLTEIDSKKLLNCYGIPVNETEVAKDEEIAVMLAEEMGYPVAVKIYSPDVTHKTDSGGVVLNVGSPAGIRQAFSKVTESVRLYQRDAKIEGVTIQPMLNRPDYELILGVKKDRDFGPVLLFGTGGIFTEIIQDRALALPPLNRLLARRMMEETKIFRVLKGYRNYPGANIMQIEEILIRLSQLVTDFSQISEIDINPLIITDRFAVAVDARIIVEPETVAAPLHLVISPYPDQYESYVEIMDVGRLLIRPIRPEDASLLTELFEKLSKQSIYYRFFSPMKKLPQNMLARFTQIDYDREIALVAILNSMGSEQMLGVGRVIIEYDQKNAEFAVLVGDEWHGKGIGAELMKRCLKIARMRNIERVWGLVLSDNTNMLALGKKLGFSRKLVHNSSAFELSYNFADGQDATELDQLHSVA
ncbi:MAG: bifunctional acetate--CoA ligase family protein/GNAT family N-acetyltransferase [Desulfobacterales bacterium]|nr:bifunctional acetate--CoA ligase family protein/GNAT family N-acetyltransferase [Desulfobacterales bacterium]